MTTISRTIKVLNGKTQCQLKLENFEGSTLADLKEELRNKDMEYEDMEFFEGKSKTQLISDDSQLPTNINYRGEITNDLNIMLNPSKSKIKSGIMDRKEVFEKIKELSLQEIVKKTFGKNFTQCKTDDLVKVIEDNQPVVRITKVSNNIAVCKVANANTNKTSVNNENNLTNVIETLTERVWILEQAMCKFETTVAILAKKSLSTKETEVFSQDELDDFDFLK